MKSLLGILFFLFFYLTISKAAEAKYQSIIHLINRILPGKSSQFVIEDFKTNNSKDAFELSSKNGKIVIKGNTSLAFARGLNWYLNYYCHTRVSWYKDDPIIAPDVLPMVDTPIIRECRFEKRFFLNYCTFGYTMLWWQWNDWERFIDWMALNGINMPLAITGQEAIWMEVWKSFGISEDQVRAYFTGPAHLPWHRMGNLDGFLGPLPQEYIIGQMNLQKKILERERSFGMTPVLPAFAGHVPQAIKKSFPNSVITSMGSYGTGKEYEAFFLDPMDPLFSEIQQKFLKIQTKYYGTDHYYCADPFNEMNPPDTTPKYLGSVSKAIFNGMNSADPKAIWVQMGWTFYFMKLWNDNPARLKAMIDAIPEREW
jgi:alpha-N-acetylglucosaminidase